MQSNNNTQYNRLMVDEGVGAHSSIYRRGGRQTDTVHGMNVIRHAGVDSKMTILDDQAHHK